jgi:phosphate transport system protein
MGQHLDHDLELLKKEILTMGAMVEEALLKATTALMSRRPELAWEVLGRDQEIDRKELAVEEECLRLLALHQPVAKDLRFIVAVMKVNNDLERMGDLGANIAERAAYLCRQDPIPVPAVFEQLVERVRAMVRGGLDALVNQDPMLARKVCRDDDEVDDFHRQMYRILEKIMADDPVTISRAINTLSCSRNLERIADAATNIAEDVVFMVEGEVIRHRSGSFWKTDE